MGKRSLFASLALILGFVVTALVITALSGAARAEPEFNPAELSSVDFIPWDRRGQIDYAPGRVVVKFTPDKRALVSTSEALDTDQSSLNDLLTSVGVISAEPVFPSPDAVSALDVQRLVPDRMGLSHIHRLCLSPESEVTRVVEALSSDPRIEWAEPDYVAHVAFTPNDPHYTDQWGLVQIHADQAWDVTQGSPAVAIAIVDTGIDLDHPDLAGKLWVNPGEIPGNGIDDDGNGKIDDVNGWDWVNGDNSPQDDIGHGSHVAGVVAGATNNSVGIAGACPNCRVMALKVLDAGGSGTYSDIAAGITYAVDKGAKVINLSLGGYADSQLLRDAVAYASQYAVVVAAGGNDSKQERFYPAAYDDYVVAVAATDNSDEKTAFSNYGEWVDISAPGVSIWSTVYDDGYAAWSGSSMAAPFVSGVAGLVRSQNPSWSAGAVRGQLLHTADGIDGLNPGYEGKLGMGRVNAYQAVTVTAEPELSIVEYAIGGVPNGNPEPGSTVTMTVSLQNTWGDAESVTGVLNTADSYVTLTDSAAVYGDMAGYRTVTNTTDTFGFLLAAGAPYNHPIHFSLTLSGDGGGYTATLPLTVTVASGIVYEGGVIGQNTTWTSDKIHRITANVLVTQGVTLTVEAGTLVYIEDDKYVEVQGTLRVEGESSNVVYFLPLGAGHWGGIYFRPLAQPWDETTGSGSILEYCYLYGGGADPGVSDVMKRDTIVADTTGIKIEHCTIGGSADDGIRTDANTIVRYNRIHNNSSRGILTWGQSIISFNVLRNNSPAIYATSSSNPSIYANLIAENGGGTYEGGIRIDGMASITSNLMFGNMNNDVAFVGPGSTGTLANNNFTGDSTFAVFLYQTIADVPASGNWWGTTSTEVIDQRVFDHNDDFVLGTVQYEPILGRPSDTTPPIASDIVLNPASPVSIGPITLTLNFSKPMSSTTCPTVTFGISPTYNTHIVVGDWVSTTQWAGIYDVTYYTGDGVQRLRVAGAVGGDDGMEIPEDARFTFEIATIGATGINAQEGYGYVALSWNPSDLETAAGYNLYRAPTPGGPYTRLNDTVLSTTSYTDTGVTNGTPYYYVVKLLTTDLYEMDYGSEVAATPNDYTAPSTPVVVDDGTCTPYTDRLHATWSASDPDSGISEYQYSIGTWTGGTDVVNWTSVGANTEVTRTGLSLIDSVTYYVNVKAKNGVGTWSNVGSSDGILISSGCPVADFAADPTSGQPPLDVQFTDQSSGTIDTWLWEFGDGMTSTQQSPTHTYAITGTFTISLTVSGPGGIDTEAKVDCVEVREEYEVFLPLVLRTYADGDVSIGRRLKLGRKIWVPE